jgi:signal transduction histidine kinase
MKRKIILGLSVYSALFLFMGLYIIYSIQFGTVKLNELIQLHQVEILREHFLIQIKRVQSDLALKNTPHSKRFDTIVVDVRNMEKVIGACFGCHHAGEVQAELDKLRDSTNRYKDAMGRVLTYRASTSRLVEEEDIAFRAGEVLAEQVRDMVALTSARLNAKTEGALRDIARSRNVLYILIAMGPLVSLVLAVLFIRGFTKPVHQLLDATRILKSGNLDHRVEGLKEEFGELASSFNEMAGSIREQMRRMREAEQTLAAANRELKLAQEQMVRAETMAAVGTLSSGISHELTTPLSVILNMVQLVRQDVLENTGLARDLEVIEEEAKQAIKVTRSLLGFTRTIKSHRESVSLNQILEDLFKILEFQPAARSVKLVRDLAPDLKAIDVNGGQIRQVFLNIILNAVQAMPDGGELRIVTRNRAGDLSDGVEVAVSDTGAGIAEDTAKQIFQPFFTTKQEGTGLGLAISYGIVQEHNGRIDVESVMGKGTTFRVYLPAGAGLPGAE